MRSVKLAWALGLGTLAWACGGSSDGDLFGPTGSDGGPGASDAVAADASSGDDGGGSLDAGSSGDATVGPDASERDAAGPDATSGDGAAKDAGADVVDPCPPDAVTCSGKCGVVVNTCGRKVDCGSCFPEPPTGPTVDPATCAEAAQLRSYMGCEFWPTVLPNAVWSNFDFTAVVSNTGGRPASVTITGPNGFRATRVVAAGTLQPFYLPWVKNLKAGDADACGSPPDITASVYESGGAYRLTSDLPVVVYQFNALEYQAAGGSGNWATCPGTVQTCMSNPLAPEKVGCFSFTNDASLLLPTTALTGNYRVGGQTGSTDPGSPPLTPEKPINGPYFAITATADATDVAVVLPSGGKVLAGGAKIAATAGGATLNVRMDRAGDVALVVGDKGKAFDFSGSHVIASKPVQVLSGVSCITQPFGAAACDHVEESVLPVETLGRRYVVTVPTGPNGNVVGHLLRLVGNQDNTALTYQPSKPAGCPDTLNAGQTVDCGRVSSDFEVVGDKEFAISAFMLGGSVVDPAPLTPPASFKSKGDPSQTAIVAVEQYRTRYLFLAPMDYDVSYVDIVGAADAQVVLDGVAVSAPWTAIGSRGLGVWRVKLGAGKNGAHALTSQKSVGIQVMGYGAYTSYQVPGGLDLRRIVVPR